MKIFDYLKENGNNSAKTTGSGNTTTTQQNGSGQKSGGFANTVENTLNAGNTLAGIIKSPNRKTTYTVNANNQPYVDQLNALYDQVMNRKPFQYDLNSDLLYKQMADQYTMLGQQAMMDTMGQAAALTGGYGNSYAQSVGNQAYQQALSGLTEQIPAMYQQAYNVYQGDTDRLLQQYELAAQHPGIVDTMSPKTVTVGSSDGTADYAAALLKMLAAGNGYSNELANWVYNPYNKK